MAPSWTRRSVWALTLGAATLANGCGQQAIYLTYRRDPEDCNAIAQSGHIHPAPFQQPGMLP